MKTMKGFSAILQIETWTGLNIKGWDSYIVTSIQNPIKGKVLVLFHKAASWRGVAVERCSTLLIELSQSTPPVLERISENTWLWKTKI